MKNPMQNHSFRLGQKIYTTVLGINWDIEKDKIVFFFDDIIELSHKLPLNKRNILCVGTKFYDPFGIISPITIQAKIIFQQLCVLKTDWDDECPEEIKFKGKGFIDELEEMGMISLPRYVAFDKLEKISDIEIHGFSDSSTVAYSAVVYVRFKEESYYMKLIASKTKVAHYKTYDYSKIRTYRMFVIGQIDNKFEGY